MATQLAMLEAVEERPYQAPFVSTRFQGSKKKLTEWIWSKICHLDFDSAIDLFGGTASVSHLLKSAAKRVVYNDNMLFNCQMAAALIANESVKLTAEETDALLQRHHTLRYPSFIADTFSGIYFTDDENVWLDQTLHNIENLLSDEHRRCIARFAVYQSCIIKRPYNLFHRSNLYMRTADVERSFGNAVTWRKPFALFFRRFVREANKAIFDNGRENVVLNLDAMAVEDNAALVYIDPPYVSNIGTAADYFAFYHFLEGMADYCHWGKRIDRTTKNLAIPSPETPWLKPKLVTCAFFAVLERYAGRVLVVSYRDDGVPSTEAIVDKLRSLGKEVAVHRLPQKYVLSTRATHEVLIVAS